MMRKPRKARGRGRPPPRRNAKVSRVRAANPQPYESLPALQLIYETAPVGLAFLTPDCRYLQINKHLTEICGISVADHIGRTVRDTVPQVAGEVEKLVQTVVHTGKPIIGVEVRGQRSDGSNADQVWVTNWHPLKDSRGNVVGVNVVAEEVTERKRAEAELAANAKALRELNETLEQRVEAETRQRLQIWNVTQDLLVVADSEGKYLSVNPAWTATLGWPDSDLIGKTSEWLLHPDDREKTRAEIRHLAAGGRTSSLFENRVRHRDGSYRWLSWKSAMDRGRIYAMARDVTELKEAEDDLREARQELAQTARRTALAAMTASIAHEIKQPLAATVTNAGAALRWLARTQPDLDEARAALGRIVADGHRASEVIQSVRAMFSKDEQDGSPLDANKLIEETIAIIRGELDRARIGVQLELERPLPLLSARRGQLQQVILNLVTNAADALRTVADRDRVLRIKSEVLETNSVAVSVHDSGPGIEPEHIDHLFDAFFTTKSGGMGMGLSISRSIVEAHGGRLSVSPGVPHGCVFRVVLPCH